MMNIMSIIIFMDLLLVIANIALRYVLENKLTRKRKIMVTWGISGGFGLVSLVCMMLPFMVHRRFLPHEYILAADIILFISMCLTAFFWQYKSVKDVNDVIFEHKLVYIDQGGTNPKNGKPIKPKKPRIYHGYSSDRISVMGGIPCKLHTFSWQMSDEVKEEDDRGYGSFSQLTKHLTEIFPEYVWYFWKDMDKMNLYAQPQDWKVDKIKWNFVQPLSSVLPWWMIPIGSGNVVTDLFKTSEMQVLSLHEFSQNEESVPNVEKVDLDEVVDDNFDIAGADQEEQNTDQNQHLEKSKIKQPRNSSKNKVSNKKGFDKKGRPLLSNFVGKGKSDLLDENTFQQLLTTKNYQNNHWLRECIPLQNGCIVGPEYSRRSLVNSILAHLSQHDNVQLYLYNAIPEDEFALLSYMRNVKIFSKSLAESYEIIKLFLYELTKRYNAIKKLGCKRLPLDGKANCDNCVVINGHVLHVDERIHIRIANDERDIKAIDIQPGMEVVIEGSRLFRIPNHWEVATVHTIQIGGEYEFQPMVLVGDDWARMIEDNGEISDGVSNTNPLKRGIGAGEVSNGVMVNEIKNALMLIVQYGERVNMHTFLMGNDDLNEGIFPEGLMQWVPFRSVNGEILDSAYQVIMTDDEHLSLTEKEKKLLQRDLLSINAIVGKEHKLVDCIQSENGDLYHVPELKMITNQVETTSDDVMRASGLQKKEIDDIKKGKVIAKGIKPLVFEQYGGTLPSVMADGVEIDYGIAGEKREKSKIKVTQEVHIGGKRIVLNMSNKVDDKELHEEDRTAKTAQDNINQANQILQSLEDREKKDEESDFQEVTVIVGEEENVVEKVKRNDNIDIVDTGRIDIIDEELQIVGDSSSLAAQYVQQTDESDPFNIAK